MLARVALVVIIAGGAAGTVVLPPLRKPVEHDNVIREQGKEREKGEMVNSFQIVVIPDRQLWVCMLYEARLGML